MREVRTCDFCGDQAAGVFEVVPPGRDPSGEGRRMILCSGCRDTLASVLEPLLDGGSDGGRARGEESSTTTVVTEPDRETDAGTRTNANTVTDTDTTTDTDIATALDRATTAGREEVGSPPNTDAGTGASSARETASGASEGTAGGDVEEAGGRPGRARRGTPRGYRKVMRFLENREFPMDREEAETMITEAYGLDPESVSEIIDHAVKHNRLRAASGKLFQ